MSKKNKSVQGAQNPAKNTVQISAVVAKPGGNFVTVMSKLPTGLVFTTPDGKSTLLTV